MVFYIYIFKNICFPTAQILMGWFPLVISHSCIFDRTWTCLICPFCGFYVCYFITYLEVSCHSNLSLPPPPGGKSFRNKVWGDQTVIERDQPPAELGRRVSTCPRAFPYLWERRPAALTWSLVISSVDRQSSPAGWFPFAIFLLLLRFGGCEGRKATRLPWRGILGSLC